MKHQRVLLLIFVQGTLACFPTNQRQYQYGTPNVQFQSAPQPQQTGFVQAPQQGFVQQPVAQQPVFAQAQAAGPAPTQPIAQSPRGSVLENLLGHRIGLSEFSADGYNSAMGGPVRSGSSLSCDFDGRPCCWANVAPPDDQLDWQIATGPAEAAAFRNAPAPQGSYLIAYARGAAPSDEAQFASCSIGCASSDIRVRAKHWQSENVLLQVCLRESFPVNDEHNPLLNCQEFPVVSGMGRTELVLPKSSLVDVVFVASNFIGENGDMAIIDDIEVMYDASGPECQNDQHEVKQELEAAHRQTLETSNNQKTVQLPQKVLPEQKMIGENEVQPKIHHEKAFGTETGKGEFEAMPAIDRFGEKGFRGGEAAFGNRKEQAASAAAAAASAAVGVDEAEEEEMVIPSVKKAKGENEITAKGAKTTKFSDAVCQSTKCDFENGDTCNYKDAHQTKSLRGLTTKFQVVSGQFMNRVTGVKESIEGDYYAATFLFPREMAGLETATDPFTEQSRIRFHYYEGTHGVQLKGCCGGIENCPFSSDKFVSVSDRVWKTASFKCPKGTDKVIFICENTRTNQGACAVDDVAMVELEGGLQSVKALC